MIFRHRRHQALRQSSLTHGAFLSQRSLMFSPLLNSSRSSVASVGSSFHSWEDRRGVYYQESQRVGNHSVSGTSVGSDAEELA